jgi:hypothetical protein
VLKDIELNHITCTTGYPTSSKIVFCFLCHAIYNLDCKKFPEIQYKIPKVMFIVMQSSHSPTFEREKVFPPRKAALPPLKPLVNGLLQCLSLALWCSRKLLFSEDRTGENLML